MEQSQRDHVALHVAYPWLWQTTQGERESHHAKCENQQIAPTECQPGKNAVTVRYWTPHVPHMDRNVLHHRRGVCREVVAHRLGIDCRRFHFSREGGHRRGWR